MSMKVCGQTGIQTHDPSIAVHYENVDNQSDLLQTAPYKLAIGTEIENKSGFCTQIGSMSPKS